MSTYYVCSDNIDGKENSRIEELCSALKKAGHEAINGGVGPNTIQSHGQTSASNGQIGVFICGGVDIQVFWDFVQGIGSYYHYKRFIYVYASDTATSDKWLTCNGAKNTPTVQAWDDNYSGGQGDAIGKTVDAYCNEHKDKIWYACGPQGCSFKDVIDNFLKGEGAGSSDSGEAKQGSSASSIKECVQKLLTHWDGEVECYFKGDEVHINKVREPSKYYIGVLQEGSNVFMESISLTDVNPNTPNILEVEWTDGVIELRDELLIKRFGEVKKTLTAVKKEIIEEVKTDTSSTASTDTTSTDTTSTSIDTTSTASTDTTSTSDTSASGADTGTTSDDTNTTKTSVKETPIDNYKDALDFANCEWNKIKRDNGRQLDLQTLGSTVWKSGEWVKVVLPSYSINGYMYIVRSSQSLDGGDWTCNLSLLDYPTGWGKETIENKSDDGSDVNSGDVGSVVDTICKEIGQFSYSSECSDAECIKSTKRGECWALSDYIYKRLKESGIKAKVHQYGTSSAGNHRQVSYYDGSNWVMFPYSKSGIDHFFYTNEIPSNTEIVQE